MLSIKARFRAAEMGFMLPGFIGVCVIQEGLRLHGTVLISDTDYDLGLSTKGFTTVSPLCSPLT